MNVAILAIVWLINLAHGYSYEDKIHLFNERTELYNELNPDLSDKARAPNDGLDELRAKLWRFNELDKRYLERDELDMQFIENALAWRDKREVVVLYAENVAALVWLDLKTGKTKNVSTFFGRNVYRIRQIAEDQGLLAQEVTANFASPEQSRSPAANANPEANAANYAESLMQNNRERYKPRKLKAADRAADKRYKLISIDRRQGYR